jgi:hypothetical protein
MGKNQSVNMKKLKHVDINYQTRITSPEYFKDIEEYFYNFIWKNIKNQSVRIFRGYYGKSLGILDEIILIY